jgi:hypothetical protein
VKHPPPTWSNHNPPQKSSVSTGQPSFAEACGKKIADFKKETNDRKLNAIMAEAVEAIKGAEMKVKAHAEVAKVFSEDLNSVGKLKKRR